ncbi:MAG TPA: hypothetical protein VM120_25165, partial [Bryobacteraceae bacterium]|nr:hypothetical protein [Bryobacteraceae bacterium]
RDGLGENVFSRDPEACSWCLSGAVRAENSSWSSRRIRRILTEEVGRILAEWNDDPTTTHGDVMALLDRCIARAEEQEGVRV